MRKKLFTYVFSIFIKNKNDIEALDGFRAFSMMAIFVFHIWAIVYFWGVDRPYFVDYLVEDATVSVDLFFILSGFLVYGGLLNHYEKTQKVEYGKYLLKRTFRIFPAYYIFCLVNYFFIKTQIKILQTKPDPTIIDMALWVGALERMDYWVFDFTYLSNYFTGNVVHGWSLSIEEHFYILLPIVAAVFLFKLEKKRRLQVLIALYFLPLLFRFIHTFINIDNLESITSYIYRATHTRIDSIFVGIIIYEIVIYYENIYTALLKKENRIYLYIVFVFSAIAFHYSNLYSNLFLRNTIKYNFGNIALGLLVFISFDTKTWIAKFFSLSFFRPIARISYGIYLWHIVIGGAIFGTIVKSKETFTWTSFFLGILASFAVTFLFAWIFYLLIEAPFLKLKEWIAKSPSLVTSSKTK